MKKLFIVLLCPLGLQAVPDLPSYPISLKSALSQPTVEEAQDAFENLTYYKLLRSIEQYVYFVKALKLDPVEVTPAFFSQVFQSSNPITTKIATLMNASADNTIPGIASQFLEEIKNKSIY